MTAQTPVDGRELQFRQFHREHDPKVRKMVANRIPHHAVDEVVQDAWMAFFLKWDAHIAHRNPPALLMMITGRRAVDWVRNQERFGVCVGQGALREQQAKRRASVADEICDYVSMRIDLREALRELPSQRHRNVLVLHYIDDLAPNTVAAMLDISRSTFYNVCKEALERLASSDHLRPDHSDQPRKEVDE